MRVGTGGRATSVVGAGGDPFRRLCTVLQPLVEPGTYFGGNALVALDGEPVEEALSLGAWQGLFEPEGLLCGSGFVPAGEVEPRIPLDTAVRFAEHDGPGCVPGLSFGSGGRCLAVATLAARWQPEAAGHRAPRPPLPAGTAVDDIAAIAHAVLADAPPFVRILPEVEQNLLPFLLSSVPMERTLARATLSPEGDGEEHMWLALPLDARWRRAMQVGLRGSDLDASCVVGALFVGENGRIVPGRSRGQAEGGALAFTSSAEPLGRGVMVLLLWRRRLEIDALLVTGDPAW
jgi:hypothetical protein